MPFPTSEENVNAAEEALGRTLPAPLRERLMRDNGGEIEVEGVPGDDPVWYLHPVWDAGDRKRIARTASHVVRETREAHDSIEHLPADSVVIASDGSGDLLLVLPGGEDVVWWDHETGDVARVRVDWS